MIGRVAILKRGDREIRMLCPDQDAALQWMKDNFQKDDEWLCIRNWDWRTLPRVIPPPVEVVNRRQIVATLRRLIFR
jgi:hypothetical protein